LIATKEVAMTISLKTILKNLFQVISALFFVIFALNAAQNNISHFVKSFSAASLTVNESTPNYN
jgi:hypothetical protein